MNEQVEQAAEKLGEHLARFRDQGLAAEPVVLNDPAAGGDAGGDAGGAPVAVLVPFALFELLVQIAAEVATVELARRRLADDSGERVSLADAAARFDVDLDAL